jgi:uncharacterized protein (TIGR02118 family)
MIKILGLLTRKDGITHEQFVHHWFDIHAPLALAVPGIRGYVQSTSREHAPAPTSAKRTSRSMGSPNSGTRTGKVSGAPQPHPK